jgi:hypothetical protein
MHVDKMLLIRRHPHSCSFLLLGEFGKLLPVIIKKVTHRERQLCCDAPQLSRARVSRLLLPPSYLTILRSKQDKQYLLYK